MGRAKCAGCGKYGPDRCTCENFRKVAKKKEKTEKTPNPTVVPKGNAVPSPTASSSSTPTTRHKTERQLELELEIEKNRTQRALALSKCLDAVKAQNERQAAVKAAEAREKERVKEQEARKWWTPVVNPQGVTARQRKPRSWSWAQQEEWASMQNDGMQ